MTSLNTSLISGASLLLFLILAAGCSVGARSTIPREFLNQAEPGVTLTALTVHPDRYQGKVVILGGVPVAEVREGDRLWLSLRNRPLDAEYMPHRPLAPGGPEDGHYWVLVSSSEFPETSHMWARLTIVGRVLPQPIQAPRQVTAEQNPVLAALFIRAWPVDQSNTESWQSRRDPHYLDPRGYGEPSQRHCWTCGSPYGGE